jgi:hypothetical protein
MALKFFDDARDETHGRLSNRLRAKEQCFSATRDTAAV